MKIKRYLMLVAACTLFLGKSFAANNEKPFVIPELQEWRGAQGMFTPSATSRIVYAGKDPAVARVANQFAEDYETMFGRKLAVVQGRASAGDFVFSISGDKQLGEEGYAVKIADRVTVSAPKAKGLYWATRTLLQMTEQNSDLALSKGSMRDYPDYAIRGFMMDCGRKFIPMNFLRDYVKMMAYYKMNTLQVHLNDNAFKQYFEHDWNKTYAAFRLESEFFPGLTSRDGYYTKKEFIDFQLMADSLGVEIIPEIDVPAHSLALTHYRPEIGSEEYGMDHLDLFKPETYQFVDSLFREYLEGRNPVFVGKRVHIGTDEYSNKKKDVVEKFREFTDHYIRFVEGFGKQACVWGALTHAKGDTPVKSKNVLMNAWYNGYAEPKDMIKQGYDLLSVPDGYLYIVPAAGYYYDYLNTEMLYKEWTPAHIGKEVFPEKHKQIKGGMFAVWNDHAGNGISTKDIHYRVFPALQTLAVKMWTGKDCKVPYETFNAARLSLSEGPGVNVAGRIGKTPRAVYNQETLKPGTETGLKEIGYQYTVSFNITSVPEERGTELFRSPDAVFYLSDPVSGKLGFARDGYLNTFNYQFYPDEMASIAISGDEKSTRLYVNGQLKEDLNIQKRFFNGGKDSMSYVRTLVFPLEKAGNFKSTITNLEVLNYCK
ncbi:beta-N-acetylhexosaminidase [Parabacteroides sp. AM58-2XD]|jgi:hexosaminidase|uniref:Family 20 glycosylhydrolase n=1 Tax=Parabacteroides segnis TaxID=2763058 RepID=A0ABR7DVQ4_9BACT|nr:MULTISPECIES: family 20 glycosylhydrolase [Parabacteroides]MBC5641600.1 family 20 glycosylhydrolase [Parabacteroides segnis]MCM0711504.1 family 20 glycosylhydrolase [Parabacteroides sp. TA-V-105]RGZ03009.1 beta-N-acetylhexosaminidase [Parabacteroides sp. AM58-2XD]